MGRSMMSTIEKSSSFLGLDRSVGVSVILDDQAQDEFYEPLKIFYKRESADTEEQPLPMPDPSNPDAHPIDLLVSEQIKDLLFKFLIHEE